jgi:hypothetical protein
MDPANAPAPGTEAAPGTWFHITAADTTVTLVADRTGEASFTVTNARQQAIRGDLVAVPAGGESAADSSWFAIQRPSRDFAVDATEQVVVTISVPPSVPASTYAFLLRSIVAGGIPEEDYGDSPVVRFEVPPLPAEPRPQEPVPAPRRSPWPWIALALAIALIAVLAIVAFAYLRVDVPNLVGKQSNEADQILAGLDLKSSKTSILSLNAPGEVVSQEPTGGSAWRFLGTVSYVYSLGGGFVPDILGKSVADAQAAATAVALPSQVREMPCPSDGFDPARMLVCFEQIVDQGGVEQAIGYLPCLAIAERDPAVNVIRAAGGNADSAFSLPEWNHGEVCAQDPAPGSEMTGVPQVTIYIRGG